MCLCLREFLSWSLRPVEKFFNGQESSAVCYDYSQMELASFWTYSEFLRSSASTRLIHLITLSASASTSVGIMTPICFAV